MFVAAKSMGPKSFKAGEVVPDDVANSWKILSRLINRGTVLHVTDFDAFKKAVADGEVPTHLAPGTHRLRLARACRALRAVWSKGAPKTVKPAPAPEPLPVEDTPVSDEALTRTGLMKMAKSDLVALAESMGIDCEGATKAEIVDVVLEEDE